MEQEHKASLHARRSAMTFVCSLCDDSIVQRALPQVVIGNETPMSGPRQNHCLDTRIVLARPMSGVDNSDERSDEGATSASFVPSMAASAASSAAANVMESFAQSMNTVLPKDPLGAQIEALRKERQDIQDKKKKLQKDLRNAERKKRRLSERARKLSDKDLVAVLMMRKNQREARAGQPCEGDAGALRQADPSAAASSRDSAI